MVKTKQTRMIALLLILLMLLPLGTAAFASMEIPTMLPSELAGRRHPDKTGDEALLYDYLAGNLMQLTECERTFNVLYDGMPVSFPPSDVPYRPEQIAVLMLGVAPRSWAEIAHKRPIPVEAVGYVHDTNMEAGFFRRIWNSLTGISPLQALPESGHITNHGYITAGAFGTTGGRYSITIDGVELPAFCNNRNIPGPATGASHRILELDNPQIIRALYFGLGGPGDIFDSNQMAEAVLATTVVTSHISVGTANPAEHNLQGSRDLWARVLNTENYPMQHNVQGIFIEVLATGAQNLVALRVLPDTPPPPPPDEGTLRIIKTSESGNVQGIQFRVTGVGVNQVVTTSVGGTIDIPGLESDMVLTVTEINLGEEYEPQASQTVTIIANQTVEVRFHNRLRIPDPDPGTLRIIKTSESGNVSGIQFRVTGNGVNQTVTTSADGTIEIPDLEAGTYTVEEINLGAQYQSQAAQTVTVRDGETATVMFHNRLLRGSVEGLKVGETTEGMLSGAFTDADGLAGALIGLFSSDEEYFTEETALETTITDEYGRFAFRNLPFGDYLIRELAAPEAYVLNEEVIAIRIDEQAQTIEISILNTLKRGDIEGMKTGETTEEAFAGRFNDREGLAGATIGLFGLVELGYAVLADEGADALNAEDDEDDIETEEDTSEKIILSIAGIPLEDFEFTSENAVQIVITDEDGSFAFSDVIVGHWVVREVYSPEAYTLNETLFLVEIREDGEVVEVEIENVLIRGNVEGIKICSTTGYPLEGATFGLFASDETTFTENTALLTDTSGADGLFGFENIPFSRYLVRELEAPEGFLLSDEIFEIEIGYDEQIVDIRAYNEPEPEDEEEPEEGPIPDPEDEPEDDPKEPKPTPNPTPTPKPNRPSTTAPKTGDDTNLPWLPLIFSGVGIGAIGVTLVVRYAKQKKSN